ncbi:hypothetical protein BEN71_08805 [Acinetobacter wuhouensis]|uniref:hypothetical protein n=1 Tax=Acinetobacter wuhouensis TaxID=1879050 RepID=UPI000839FE27|nr:hypothetical protein [Acinetobacter wuhouensis]AXQ22164.1 hypothetical protein BEN71_08805 [Acinetobacter wuhouensis]
MSKQSRFLCIGGFLNGTQVKDQGDSFVCIKNGKHVTYFKKAIFNQDSYICETISNSDVINWVYDIKLERER